MAASIVGSDVNFGVVGGSDGVVLTIPGGVTADDIIIVQAGLRNRPDVSSDFVDMGIQRDDVLAQELFNDDVVNAPITDSDDNFFFHVRNTEQPTFEAIYGPQLIQTFARLADGTEGGNTVTLFAKIGRGKVGRRGFANVVAGLIVIRGAVWVADTGISIERISSSTTLAAPPKTVALPAASPVGIAWSFTVFAGTIGSTPTAPGWVLEDIPAQLSPGILHQQLAGAMFTRVHAGGALAVSDISQTSLEDVEWFSVGGNLEVLGTKVHPVILSLLVLNAQGPPENLGTDVVDNSGGGEADPVWFTWPEPEIDETLQPPNPPYRDPGTGNFREVK